MVAAKATTVVWLLGIPAASKGTLVSAIFGAARGHGQAVQMHWKLHGMGCTPALSYKHRRSPIHLPLPLTMLVAVPKQAAHRGWAGMLQSVLGSRAQACRGALGVGAEEEQHPVPMATMSQEGKLSQRQPTAVGAVLTGDEQQAQQNKDHVQLSSRVDKHCHMIHHEIG
jgi:hypothetical protein